MVADSSWKHFPPNGELLAEARQGSREALGRMLESCRTYLMLVASKELHSELRAKLGPSDIVQETFVTAQRVFARFNGDSLEELLAWLRQILLNKISEARRRYYHAQGRSLAREVNGNGNTDAHQMAVEQAGQGPTAHGQLVSVETAEHVSRAIVQLSPDHQQVIQLRNWQMLPFEEIGLAMGRSPAAARALWMRALQQLAKVLESRNERR
jgi:RNA polymerase sigma-70 factor (ECF subfamily)